MADLVQNYLGFSPYALAWICAGAFTAGVVRGFSGFGTAMIFLPFASSVMSPAWAVTVLVVMEFLSSAAIFRRMAKDAEIGELVRLVVGALIAVPFGVAVLILIDAEVFKYAVSVLTLGMLAFLLAGVRLKTTVNNAVVYGAGGIGGFMAGAVGLPGPPVILLYLARPLGPVAIRATLFTYLVITDIMLFGVFAASGILERDPIVTGLFAAIPFAAGMAVGAFIFSPEKAKVYRYVAYCIVGASAVMGLPVWR